MAQNEATNFWRRADNYPSFPTSIEFFPRRPSFERQLHVQRRHAAKLEWKICYQLIKPSIVLEDEFGLVEQCDPRLDSGVPVILVSADQRARRDGGQHGAILRLEEDGA